MNIESASLAILINIKLKNCDDAGGIEVNFQTDSGDDLEESREVVRVTAKYVFNCTYSALNTILSASHLPTIPLKHELTEMALVEVPPPLKHLGITVMCGPLPERGDISQPTTMDSEQITKNPPFPPRSPIPQIKIVGVVVLHQALPNLTCVLGGKIDNVYDIPSELEFIEQGGIKKT